MANVFNSPIFGETRMPTDEERTAIKKFTDEVPVGVFQELNKKLNDIGFCISIMAKEEAQ